MCGIFAILNKKTSFSESNEEFLELINHRGPDSKNHVKISMGDINSKNESEVWLGHVRLSIIDLSDSGNQPMSSNDGRYWIVYNGEIYNYLELKNELTLKGVNFRTNSDTEVLLNAWIYYGENCLTMLKGMFAFVIVDTFKKDATLVRDFFGIKPLYYSDTEDFIVISSEVKPIIEYLRNQNIPVMLNASVLYEYIRFGATHLNDETMYLNIKSMSPSSLKKFDFTNEIFDSEIKYWDLQKTSRIINFKDATNEFRERFLDNIKLHLRSDVPLAAALSGGLDSSAIVCAAKYLEPELNINCYSYISENKKTSEEKWVDIVHKHIGGKCTKIRPESSDLAGDFKDLVIHQGEPFTSASIYAQYRVFKSVSEDGIKVSLDGQGADELLGGYWPHVGTFAYSLLRSGNIGGFINLIRKSHINLGGSVKLLSLVAQSVSSNSMRSNLRRMVGKGFGLPYLNNQWFLSRNVNINEIANNLIGQFDNLKDHLISSTKNGSLPNLLRYADRNSMRFSVESRVPFLTHDFAEFLMSLPDEYLVSKEGVRKHIFREAMVGILPEQIRLRTDKIGFFADDALWIRKNKNELISSIEILFKQDFFDQTELRKFLSNFYNNKHNDAQLVWRLIILGCLLKEYKL
jgi:asparagine synthase (glutamine-hydrolysing)